MMGLNLLDLVVTPKFIIIMVIIQQKNIRYDRIKPIRFEPEWLANVNRHDNMNIKHEKPIKIIGLILLLAAVLWLTAGCSPAAGVKNGVSEESPVLEDCEVYGECLGGESDQYIVALLTFDRDVKLSDGLDSQIRAVIGGKRIGEEDITAEQTGSDAVKVSLHVDRVVDGVLTLTRAPGTESVSAITNAEGTACLADLDVEQMVPSGVTIHEESQGDYVVDTVPTHRSIVWIRISTPQGVVSPGGAVSTDVMDDAAAVHEHEFLWATTSSVASDIADIVNQYYGPEITAKAEEDHILLSAADDGELPVLEIYEG